MSERNIDYIPISKLGRGYAGKLIDKMNENDSVIYVLKNNEPTAVIMSMKDYEDYLDVLKANDRVNKKQASERSAGSLHEYADASKIGGEREQYHKGLYTRHGKSDIA